MDFLDGFGALMTKIAVGIKKPFIPIPADRQLVTGRFCEIPLPGVVCTDGSSCKTYLRQGTSDDLVVFLNGGGAAWDENSCAYPTTFSSFFRGKTCLYTANMGSLAEFGIFILPKDPGALGSDPAKNPFANSNMAFLQYASGDFHVGNGQLNYKDLKGSDKTMNFNGYQTFKSAMTKVAEYFPDPKRLIIVGGSAGAFGASALAGEIIDLYPECKNITVFIDSSILIKPDWKEIAQNIWQAPAHISDMIKTDDIGGDWLEALAKKYGHRAKILYGNSIRDFILAKFQHYFTYNKLESKEVDCQAIHDWLRIRTKHLQQECPGICYYFNDFSDKLSGIGTEHCVLVSSSFHSKSVDGVTPAQWLQDAVDGKLYNVGMRLLEE